MTFFETVAFSASFLINNIPFLIFYFITGLGSGFVFGIILANTFFGTGPTYMETHRENIKKAGEHNAQWNPSHERWKQP